MRDIEFENDIEIMERSLSEYRGRPYPWKPAIRERLRDLIGFNHVNLKLGIFSFFEACGNIWLIPISLARLNTEDDKKVWYFRLFNRRVTFLEPWQ